MQHFDTTVVVKNFGHLWPLNLVRNALFVHFWPRYFCPKFLVKNTLFVHFWSRLFWPFGQKCSGQKCSGQKCSGQKRGFLTLQICHSSKKCEIKCPESRKKLTTQYKFCLTDADARGEGVGSMRTLADKGEGGQKLAKFCRRFLWMAPWPIIPVNTIVCMFATLADYPCEHYSMHVRYLGRLSLWTL